MKTAVNFNLIDVSKNNPKMGMGIQDKFELKMGSLNFFDMKIGIFFELKKSNFRNF